MKMKSLCSSLKRVLAAVLADGKSRDGSIALGLPIVSRALLLKALFIVFEIPAYP